MIGYKESKRAYIKKSYDKVKEEKRGKKLKKGKVITSLDEEEIIYHYHNDVSGDGGYISSASNVSNNEDSDPFEKSSRGSSDLESVSSESEQEFGNDVDSEICPRNCVGDLGEIFTQKFLLRNFHSVY